MKSISIVYYLYMTITCFVFIIIGKITLSMNDVYVLMIIDDYWWFLMILDVYVLRSIHH